MTTEVWLDILSRISTSTPVDLDSTVFESNRPDKDVAGKWAREIDPLPPSNSLFPKTDTTMSFIGLRVRDKNVEITQIAIRLAAAALEKNVTPIIMTTLDESGFEGFGFRVERLVGNTEQELDWQEQQLAAYWDIAIIVDVADAVFLG